MVTDSMSLKEYYYDYVTFNFFESCPILSPISDESWNLKNVKPVHKKDRCYSYMFFEIRSKYVMVADGIQGTDVYNYCFHWLLSKPSVPHLLA